MTKDGNVAGLSGVGLPESFAAKCRPWRLAASPHAVGILGRSRSAAPSRRPEDPCREGAECEAGRRKSTCLLRLNTVAMPWISRRTIPATGKAKGPPRQPLSTHYAIVVPVCRTRLPRRNPVLIDGEIRRPLPPSERRVAGRQDGAACAGLLPPRAIIDFLRRG